MLSGTTATFGKRNTNGYLWVPGAFDKSLKEHAAGKRVIPLLDSHSRTLEGVIGRVSKVWVSGNKLRFRAEWADTERASMAREMVKSGMVQGASVGAIIVNAELSDSRKNGGIDVSEADLKEISVVSMAADRSTRVTTSSASNADNSNNNEILAGMEILGEPHDSCLINSEKKESEETAMATSTTNADNSAAAVNVPVPDRSDKDALIREMIEAWEAYKTTHAQQDRDGRGIHETDTRAAKALENAEARISQLEDRLRETERKLVIESSQRGIATSQAEADVTEGRLKKFNEFLIAESLASKSSDSTPIVQARQEFVNAYPETVRADLLLSDPETGGYLAPPEFSDMVIPLLQEMSPVRPLFSQHTTTSRSFVATRILQHIDAEWTSEVGTVSEIDWDPFGEVEIHCHEMRGRMHVSRRNLMGSKRANVRIDNIITREFADQFGRTEGYVFINGRGPKGTEPMGGRPKGLLEDSAIGTVTCGTAGKVQVDDLIDLRYENLEAYSMQATWLMKRSTMAAIRKLKGEDAEFLWGDGLESGSPSILLQRPYILADAMPAIPAAGTAKKVIAFGDMKRTYQIIDREQMSYLVDPYSLAQDNKVRFFAWRSVGGDVINPNACKILITK